MSIETVTAQQPQPLPFPKLMIHENGTQIVRFKSEGVGHILTPEASFGNSPTNFDMTKYSDYHGDFIMRNIFE